MTNRYIEQLKTQLKFIENSCVLFDQGNFEEAIRLSMCFRIIFHNTRTSISILNHLDMENINILSSSCNSDNGDYKVAYLDSLIQHSATGMFPKLGNGNTALYKPLPVQDWWNETVLVSYGKYEFTRRQLILDVANKDGGGHVDRILPRNYEKLKEGDCFFVRNVEGANSTVQYKTKHLMYLRQMGWEVLNSPELMGLAN